MRHFVLRRFNRTQLKMRVDDPNISGIDRIIGVGRKMSPFTGELTKTTLTYRSFERPVAEAFVRYPIAETFGISVQDVMAMRVDRWYTLLKVIEKMPPKRSVDMEEQLLQIIKSLTGAGGEAP